MILFARTGSLAPGKETEAIGFAQEMCSYIKQTIGLDVEAFVPIGGNPMRVGWVSRHDNLQNVEDATEGLLADAGYNKRVKDAADLFIAGSMEDVLWRSIG